MSLQLVAIPAHSWPVCLFVTFFFSAQVNWCLFVQEQRVHEKTGKMRHCGSDRLGEKGKCVV